MLFKYPRDIPPPRSLHVLLGLPSYMGGGGIYLIFPPSSCNIGEHGTAYMWYTTRPSLVGAYVHTYSPLKRNKCHKPSDIA